MFETAEKSRVAFVSKGALPISDVAGGDVEITRQTAKRVGMFGFAVERSTRVDAPPIEQREALSDVAQRNRQVDHVVTELSDSVPAADLNPVIVDETNLFGGVMDS